MTHILLPHRALLAVTGPDAEHLLEGLVTSNLPQDGEVVGSALLTPQGKILFTFLISRIEGGFRLECDVAERDALLKRLMLYKLRAQVVIEADERPVHVNLAGEDGLVDRRADGLGVRVYGNGDAASEDDAYTKARFESGVLEGPEEIIGGQDFPHDVALDLTGAVSFTKGCFVGQEVVSRVKHRGTARRRPVRVEGSAIETGTALMCGEREIGTVRLSSDGAGLAIVRLDHIKGPVTAGEQHVDVSLPPYATYPLGADTSSEVS